jgi:hypothetical protein
MIGKSIPENAQFPPEINSIEAGLQAIDVAYHMNHRIDGKPLFDPKTGKMTGMKRERNTFQSEIYLTKEDGERFLLITEL